MSVEDLDKVRKEFKAKVKKEESQQFAVAQQTTINTLIEKNKTLQAKIDHLEQMLVATQARKASILNLQPEELICMEQIGSLKKKSQDRDLTLEETKKLDILVRNLKLIREDGSVLINVTESNDVMEAELVAIATNIK